MTNPGFRGLVVVGGVAAGVVLALGAYFSTKFLIGAVVQARSAR